MIACLESCRHQRRLTVFLFTVAIMNVLTAARLYGSPFRAGE
jgi:hypothetical protein